MSIDLEKVREQTPGCKERLHFNNAGAGLMPQPVVDTIVAHLDLEARIGGYEAAEVARASVERVYDAAAELINCRRDEIAVVDNATRAWDMAFYSLDFSPGDTILTCVSEYASNFIAFLQVASRTGVRIRVIPSDTSGCVNIPDLQDALDDTVKLIAITHVPTNGGLIQPVEAVGAIAREHRVTYLVDACQSIGQMPLDVQRIGCHMLSATGRKYLRGPRGTGFLYVSRDLVEDLEPPFLDLHAAQWVDRNHYKIRPDARRFENWETNYATKTAFGTAIDYALTLGVENTWPMVQSLADLLRSELKRLPGVVVRDLGDEKCGIVSFTAEGRTPEWLCKSFAGEHINVSVSPSYYTLLDMTNRGLSSVLRASVHYYNSQEEVERFVDVLSTLL